MKNLFSGSLATLTLVILIGCATGSSIVVGNKRAPIDSSLVKLYVEAPAEYEVVAIVEASSEVGFSTQAAQDRAVERLKVEAAKLGANGVLIESTSSETSTAYGSAGNGTFWVAEDTSKTVAGKAIYVVE